LSEKHRGFDSMDQRFDP